ncbi:hypothetical protein [Janthinobacterium agaricidamnosum]|uniref:hypothetical protein n=1 Tax=Janthinobacterium agaricidamnosum TaxID=55508 RepID=UPI00056FBA1B|nr:hypothetical protein [Janthinobacterium agaricidamnosum]
MTKNERLTLLSLTKQLVRVSDVVANIAAAMPNDNLRSACDSELKVAMDEVNEIVMAMNG